jgi:hypothetical protein
MSVYWKKYPKMMSSLHADAEVDRSRIGKYNLINKVWVDVTKPASLF